MSASFKAALVGVIAATVALAACGTRQPSFNGVDIAGVDFGRDLDLTDHTGTPRTLADFKGQSVAPMSASTALRIP